MVRHLTSPTFIGRGAQLNLLLELSRAGAPRCALVSGEAGVGKTRLTTEFTRQAEADGVMCLTGGCVPGGEQIFPLAPIVTVLHAMTDRLDAVELGEVLGPARAELARLVPTLGDGPGVGEPAAPARTFESLLGAMSRLCERTPVALVVEDMHWSDTSSRELFAYLARYLRAPMLLVATYRSDELHRRHPLRPFLAELRRAVHPEEITLTGFSSAETTELLSGVLGHEPDPALVDGVHERSGGNPFFAEELAAADVVSDSLRDVLLARAARLDDTAFRLLRVAAASGGVDADGAVAEVAGVASAGVEHVLAELASAGLLVADGDRWRFRHELAREVFEDELLPGERTRVHRELAETLMKLAPDQAGRIGWHLWRAGNQAGALEWSVRAAQEAERMGAMAEAQQGYERALDVWHQVPDAAERAGASHAELLMAAAEAAHLASRAGRAIELAESAIGELAGDPVAEGAAWVKLAGYRQFGGGLGGMLEATERALELIPVDPPSRERAWAMARHGGVLMVDGRHAEALERSREALEAARAAGSTIAELYALSTIGNATASLGDARGLDMVRDALDRAVEANQPFNIARGCWNFTWALCGYERYGDAIAAATDGRMRAADLGERLVGGVGITMKQMIALGRIGRWDDVEEEMERLRDLLGEDGLRAWDALAAVSYGLLALRRGRPDEVRDLLERAARAVTAGIGQEDVGWVAIARVELAVHDRAWDRVRPVVDDALARLSTLCPMHVPEVVATGIAAEAERSAGQATPVDGSALAVVDGWVDQAESAAQRYRETDLAPVVQIWLDQVRAEHDRLLGEPSADQWERVASGWDERGRPYEAAYARLRAAEAVLRVADLRHSDVRAQAAELLRQVHDSAARLGAAYLTEKADALARHTRTKPAEPAEPGVPSAIPAMRRTEPAIAGADGAPFGLTERELQVLALVAEGKSNGEIGTQLFVSTKTASVHVSNILRKLGAANRVEAASIAHRAGVTRAT